MLPTKEKENLPSNDKTQRELTQKRASLLDMPLNVADLVLEKLELIDLLKCRKVCQSLKNAVDNFGINFDEIFLQLWEGSVDLKFEGNEIRFTDAFDGGAFFQTRNGQKRRIEGENYVERAFKDLEIVWKHVSKLTIFNYTEATSNNINSLLKFLKSKKCAYIRKLSLRYFSFEDILTILPYFDAQMLITIRLWNTGSVEQFGRITHLEQWRNAKNFELWDYTVDSGLIDHFFQFQCFNVDKMTDFSKENAVKIRDDLMTRNTFQRCLINFDPIQFEPVQIAKVFKPDYVGGNKFNMEFSNDNGKFTIECTRWNRWLNFYTFSVKKC